MAPPSHLKGALRLFVCWVRCLAYIYLTKQQEKLIGQRRLEPVVILRNRHMTSRLLRTAQSLIMQLARKECNQTTRVAYTVQKWGMASSGVLKCIVDKNGTQYSLIPLMESKKAFDYTIPSFSVIIYRGRSESLLAGSSRRWYIVLQ